MTEVAVNPEKGSKEVVVERDEHGRLKPGSFLNPAGKPRGIKNFTSKVKEALEKIYEGKTTTTEQELIKSILHKAIVQKDPQIIKLVWNYLDGLPVARNEVGGIDGGPIQIQAVKYADTITPQVHTEGLPTPPAKST